MAEELLDDTEVRSAFQKMGCEGVAEPVGVTQEPPNGTRVEAATARGEEDGVIRVGRELRSAELEVAREPERGFLSERDDALLPSLAAHVHDLALEVDVSEVECYGLLAPQPGGVEELEQGSVSKREGRLAVDELEELVDLGGLRRVREPPRPPRGQRGFGNRRRAERVAQARADRREASRDGWRREPVSAAPELRDPVGEDARVDLAQPQPSPIEPGRERAEIGAVRTLRRR